MPSMLEIRGFWFDTEALKDAYHELPPSAREEPREYSEKSLRALVIYFVDWSPIRSESLNNSPQRELNRLSPDEKRELYHVFVQRLSENLREQYGRQVDNDDFKVFLQTVAQDQIPSHFATFILRDLWQWSKRLHEYERGLKDEGSQFVSAIHQLPRPYLDSKEAQYDSQEKINGIRYQTLQSIRSTGQLPLNELQRLQEEENIRHDTNIMLAYDEFTVLGQLYFDYFKPRLRAYLEAVTDHIKAELGVRESTAHIVDFNEPRQLLSNVTWFAFYPVDRENTLEAYQLFTGIHWDRVRFGLYAGDEIREEGAMDVLDIDTITERDSFTSERLIEKFDAVLHDYYSLNGITVSDPPEEPPKSLTDTLERQLEAEKQVVFYGPPGTGKTYEAKRFATWWVHQKCNGQLRDEQIESVTFHPSFSYEDFMEGLTAEATDTGDVEYKVEDGILKRVASNAHTAYDQWLNSNGNADPEEAPPYVLIIDEINRGNLAQIFGETITLLEKDKRGSYKTSLAHSDEKFTLPPNLYVIGTMNTADRSIALVDAALRRRFRFIPFPPDFDCLLDHHGLDRQSIGRILENGSDSTETLLVLSILALERLNERIVAAPDLSKGQQIGHSYLWDINSVEDIVDAWIFDILPLLEEYYFGQFDRIRSQLFDEQGSEIIDWEAERIKAFSPSDLGSFLDSYVDPDADVDLRVDSTASSAGSTSGTRSPEYPKALQIIGEQVFEEIGDLLQGESVDDIYSSDDLERLTFSVVSNDPDHPYHTVRYRFQIQPHRDRVHVAVTVDDEYRREIFGEFRSFMDQADLPAGLEVNDLAYSTVSKMYPIGEFEGNPYDFDGQELIDTIGGELVDQAIQEFIQLIRVLHDFFTGLEIEPVEQ